MTLAELEKAATILQHHRDMVEALRIESPILVLAGKVSLQIGHAEKIAVEVRAELLRLIGEAEAQLAGLGIEGLAPVKENV